MDEEVKAETIDNPPVLDNVDGCQYGEVDARSVVLGANLLQIDYLVTLMNMLGSRRERLATDHEKDLVRELYKGGLTVEMFAVQVKEFVLEEMAQLARPPAAPEVVQAPEESPKRKRPAKASATRIRAEEQQLLDRVILEVQMETPEAAEQQLEPAPGASRPKRASALTKKYRVDKNSETEEAKKKNEQAGSSERKQWTDSDLEDASETLEALLKLSASTQSKRTRKRSNAGFNGDCDRNRLQEVRDLLVRRSVTRSNVVKGSGVHFRKVLDWLDDLGNSLTDREGNKLIHWYENCDPTLLRCDRMHQAGRQLIDRVYEQRNYATRAMTVQESVELSDEATQLIKDTLGEYYFEEAAVSAANIRDLVRKKRSRAAEKASKDTV